MKKKKLLIIIIIGVLVLAAAGTVVFLIVTGRLFGGKDKQEAPSASISTSMAMSAITGTDEAVGPNTGTTQGADPSKFFEGHYYFQNLTGSELTEIRIAPSGTTNWEDNLLGEEMLANGETWSQSLMLRDVGSTWDLRVKTTADQEYVFTGLDMANNHSYVLSMEGSSPVLRQG